MRLRASLLALVFALAGCKSTEQSRKTAIVGAILIDGAGGPPVANSVVVISGDRIAAVGPRGTVDIPVDSNLVNGAGKYLIPALIDLSGRPDTPAGKAPLVDLSETAPDLSAAMEKARNAGLRIAGHITTAAGMRLMVDNGASFLIGVPRDTRELDPSLLARMRNLRVVTAPALRDPVEETAARNTLEMFRAGVPLGLASEGRDPVRQAELMVSAGVPPLDVIVAATENSAMALGQLEHVRRVALRINGGAAF
jgi:imidazolonepropionase-like amidohydrolase